MTNEAQRCEMSRRVVLFAEPKPQFGIAFTREHISRLCRTGKFPLKICLSHRFIGFYDLGQIGEDHLFARFKEVCVEPETFRYQDGIRRDRWPAMGRRNRFRVVPCSGASADHCRRQLERQPRQSLPVFQPLWRRRTGIVACRAARGVG